MELEIINYIKNAKNHGLHEVEIKQNLLNAGWEAEIVEESLKHAKVLENSLKNVNLEPQANQFNKPSETAATGTSHANIAISQETFQKNQTNPFFKKRFLWIFAIAIFAVLAAAGYWYYAFGNFYTPNKIWSKFLQTSNTKIYQNNFEVSYLDNGELSKDDAQNIGFELKNISLNFKGRYYLNANDEKNPESSSEIQYSFGSGNTNFSTGFKYALKDKILYFNVGENPFLNNIFKIIAQDKKIEWIKLDINAIEDELNKQNSGNPVNINELFSSQLKQDIAKIWEDSAFIKVEKYIGREKINSVNTLHFKNSIDKLAIKNAFTDSFKKIILNFNKLNANENLKIKDSDIEIMEFAISELVNKIDISQLETWIGATDFKLYKIKFVSNAPSLVSLAKIVAEESKKMNQDSIRISDIRQMASALETYYNENKGYPDGENGKPINFEPNYIEKIPVSIAPPNGKCTDYYNTYWYKPLGKKVLRDGKTLFENFELTFCLGSDTAGYKAGIGKLTPAGILDNIPCPTTTEQCLSEKTNENFTHKEKIKEIINALDFSAQFIIDSSYSNYGVKQEFNIPENSFDILDFVKKTQQNSLKTP